MAPNSLALDPAPATSLHRVLNPKCREPRVAASGLEKTAAPNGELTQPAAGLADGRLPCVPEPMTPFATGVLEVAPATELYWETSGVPDGIPLLYLHGGPGSGLGSGGWRGTYDTGRHLVVALDQRGCGASRPLVSDTPASLATNTTQALVSDIEALREHLGIEDWIVAGVSWGSTLALAYHSVTASASAHSCSPP
jgi:pimeloyl-ACP methyl ester carboxylesterase